ncbi:hypothetical protein [Pseudomonas putida]|uniref:hypothetical protein n=1 Tax=Pseudomonas putida TaxID=303 RepID=UPI0018D700B5|nr:hypothetical protein [Pseudomonas putida]MBH3458424.1 hypothetical protein [Pseudomonas putida]
MNLPLQTGHHLLQGRRFGGSTVRESAGTPNTAREGLKVVCFQRNSVDRLLSFEQRSLYRNTRIKAEFPGVALNCCLLNSGLHK